MIAVGDSPGISRSFKYVVSTLFVGDRIKVALVAFVELFSCISSDDIFVLISVIKKSTRLD